jgi:VanZ family protein
MNLFYRISQRLMPYIFWFGFVATVLVTLMPSHEIPKSFIFWDKAQHSLAFFLLMLTGCLAYPKKVIWLLIGLTIYGASIEVMQKYFTRTRSGDFLDLIADFAGIVIGYLIFLLINQRLQLQQPR